MAELKSVSFSPILEQTPDDISLGSSNTGSFPDGANFEDAYIASLSKSARKYQLPSEDEPKVSRKRKMVLLTLGFVLLLGIGGVVIYFVTRELYNKEQQYHSGALGEDRRESESRGTQIRFTTISAGSRNTIKPSSSSESKEKLVSMYSSKTTTIRLPSVSKLLTSITVIESPSLVTSFGTNKHNATTSAFWRQHFASSSKTAWHSSSVESSARFYSTMGPIKNGFKTSEIQTRTSHSLLHEANSWKGNSSKKAQLTVSSNKTTRALQPPTTSSSIIASTRCITNSDTNSSEVEKTISPTPSLFTQKTKVSENVSAQPSTVTFQDTGTPVFGLRSSGANVDPSIISAVSRKSSEIAYLSSDGGYVNSHPTTKISEHSKLGLSGSSASTSANPQSPGNSVKVSSEEMNITAYMTPGKVLSTTKPGVPPSSMIYKHSSSEKQLSGGNSSRTWMTSHPTRVELTNTAVKHTSSGKESSSLHYGSPNSVQASSTQAPSHSYGSVSSFANSQFLASQPTKAILPSRSASNLVSKGLSLKHSGSLSEEFSSVQMTPFPSSSLLTTQVSSQVQDILSPTKTTSPIATRHQSDPSSLTSQTASLVISTSPLHASHSSHDYSTVGARRDVTSLEITTSLSNDQKTRPSTQTRFRSSIKETSSSSTMSSDRNYNPASSSFTSTPKEFTSTSVTLGSSRGLVLSETSVENISTVASEKTSANSVSFWISKRTTVRYSLSTTSKQTKSSTQESVGISTVNSSVEHLNSKSTRGSVLTFSTISTKSHSLTHQHKLPTSASDAPSKSTVTSFIITRVMPSRQSTQLSEGFLSATSSLPTEETTAIITSWEYKAMSIITSRQQSLYTTTRETPETSTNTLFPKTKESSITGGLPNTVSALGRASSQDFHPRLSIGSSLTEHSLPSSRESISSPRKEVQSASTMQHHKTYQCTLLQSSTTPINTIFTSAKVSSSIKSMISSQFTPSSSRIASSTSGNRSLNMVNATYTTNKTVMTLALPSPAHTFTTQVKSISASDSHLFSSVETTFRPTLNTTMEYKIMDGSLLIRNREFHANLTNPNSTMFNDLADEVEEIITDIVSVDAVVSSFRNGSIIADFYLKVPYDSRFSDQDYAKMLSEANETLWRGYNVTKISITLRVSKGLSAKRVQDGGGLSKAATVAIFVVFSLFLIAVGGIGVYVCKKKGMCQSSRVKPSDSPIPPSELAKIQTVRRGTWVMNDEPFLKVDIPKDPNYRSASFYETLSLRVLERNNTEQGEGLDPDALRKSTRSPFEPEYSNNEGSRESVAGLAAFSTTSRTGSIKDDVDRPFSGSSGNTYLNIGADSTHSEDEC